MLIESLIWPTLQDFNPQLLNLLLIHNYILNLLSNYLITQREKLNSLNWMVEYLYRNNPRYKTQRQDMELLDIPFVQKILAKR